MSALYYLANLRTKRTYSMGTANSARYQIIDIVIKTTSIDDKIVLFSEDSHCEDVYLNEDICSNDRYIQIEGKNGEDYISREKFWEVFEEVQEEPTKASDMLGIILGVD